MPSITQHQSLEYVKGLILGDPGAGKTGSLLSLVEAGYRLCIYDFDNLLASLVQLVLEHCPDRADQVLFQTFTDKMKGNDMPLTMVGSAMKVMPFTDGTPTAFPSAMKQLNQWKTADEDLGRPADFGQDTVVVIDSLTNMAASAFRYVQAMNPMAKEPQSYYFAAQQMLINLITLLFSEQFRTNVLVLAHVAYSENQYQITKGFPRSIGSALNSQIAAYFNCVLLVETVGQGTQIKRTIRTNSTGIVDLKNPVSFRIPDSLPIDRGLADFFKAVTNHSPEGN